MKKKIRTISQSYSAPEMGIVMTPIEEDQLFQAILKQFHQNDSVPLMDIIHDVVYSYITNQN
ncbi:YqzH family protein [Halalkalibacter sp. APA_J-10(15)]|uniref:YqzH family protein n=1 Tax=Halalkalibacter sp. APA_J-10(15) TaxID=2933805 RepID=UPI0027E44159|nr:YqzH family protein [Halalkalibacter sp. APA_J-10(15)]